jgi:hypothetical protein
VVLPKNAPHSKPRPWSNDHGSPDGAPPRPAVTTLPSGRQAMNLSTARA